MSLTRDPLVRRMRPFGTTIFAEMSALALRTGAVNLGQGFPDTDGPPEMLEAAVAAVLSGANQYPPGRGIASLRRAIADHQQRFWGLEFDPDTEVVVTAGATEAIAAAVLALCEAGDEVLCFEPYYDSYAASIALAGAIRRPLTLRAEDFASDISARIAAWDVGPQARVLLLNTPHNPTGKVFSRTELEAIAALCLRHDLIAVVDEVYEHLVYEGEHVPLAALPGMRERTVTISSAGKTFSCTGWKIGWVCAPPELVTAVTAVKQFLTYTNAAPLQPAIAVALALPDSYYAELADDLRGKRDYLADALTDAGFAVHPPAGTYFITADIAELAPDADGLAFCRSLPERCGVVAVPVQVFYDDPDAGRTLVRFAFCKQEKVLAEAADRLRRAFG